MKPLWRYFKRARTFFKRVPIIPLAIIVLVIFSGLFANFLVPHNPNKVSLEDKFLSPFWAEGGSTEYPLGTDQLGRGILSRLIYGARISLQVVFFGLLIAGIIGVGLGLIAGFHGGWLDGLIMRVCDATLSFPAILLALLFAVVLGAGLNTIIIVVTIVLWARYARVVRGETLKWKQEEFVAYGRVAGTSNFKIILKHIVPNILDALVVIATFQAGWVILVEASLSFLGAGVPPPTPSWGAMISEGRPYIDTAWWICLTPGLTIVAVCFSLNFLGDWLRDTLDPKLRQI